MRFRNIKKQSKNKKTEDLKETVNYAPYSSRVKALITDLFMIYAPILYIITYVFMNGKDEFQSSQLAPLIGVSLYAIVYGLLVANFGQTPGKKAYSIKIVDAKTHETISFFRAILRFVSFLFSATILLGLLVPFYRQDKKSLHDIICNTIVIEEKD